MKAFVYHGRGKRKWECVPGPAIIEPTDAVARIDSSTICGTDLHILKGDVPEVAPGTILGPELVGSVSETGAAVTTIAVGHDLLLREEAVAVPIQAQVKADREELLTRCDEGGTP